MKRLLHTTKAPKTQKIYKFSEQVREIAENSLHEQLQTLAQEIEEKLPGQTKSQVERRTESGAFSVISHGTQTDIQLTENGTWMIDGLALEIDHEHIIAVSELINSLALKAPIELFVSGGDDLNIKRGNIAFAKYGVPIVKSKIFTQWFPEKAARKAVAQYLTGRFSKTQGPDKTA